MPSKVRELKLEEAFVNRIRTCYMNGTDIGVHSAFCFREENKKMTVKELEKEMKLLKKYITQMADDIKDLKKGPAPVATELTISSIKPGESFVYKGHNYTKLNDDNYCIIDDHDGDFMDCIFDPIDNNYDTSLIRYYINSERFINKLGIDIDDLVPHYKDDVITLLSKEEYEEYKSLIKDYDKWWATRSAYSYTNNTFCSVTYTGNITNSSVYNSYGVRAGFAFAPETRVDRKGNED